MNDKPQKWLRLDGDDGWQIIIPDWDEQAHSSSSRGKKRQLAYMQCPCRPKINALDKIIVHNSFLDTRKIDEALSVYIPTTPPVGGV